MTRAWLDRRYERTTPEGVYVAHQPIYGLGSPCSEPGQITRMARTFQILRVLDGIGFATFLDVGAAEGHLARLVRELFGADVLVGDLSTRAARRARQLFDLPGVGLDSARLPFADAAFDVVCCSEVIEHVEFPAAVLAELERVARRAVLVTTEEATADAARLAAHLAERRDLPHAERNLFHVDDFRALLGAGAHLRSEYRGTPPDDAVGVERAREWIRRAADVEDWSEEGLGVVVLAPKDGLSRVAPRVGAERLLAAATSGVCDATPLGAEPSGTGVPAGLDPRLVCPRCRGALAGGGAELRCAACGARYPVEDGVPALFDPDAPDVDAGELARELEARWRDPERVRAAVRLHGRTLLPDATDTLAWDFARAEDREAWTVGPDLVVRDGGGTDFRFASRGAGAWLVGPMCALPAPGENGVDLLELEMRVHNPAYPVGAGTGRLYWMAAGDLSFDEASCVTFPLVNDGRTHTYRVPVGEHERWPRSGALWLRLDPADGPCEVDLAALRLVPSATAGDPEDGA